MSGLLSVLLQELGVSVYPGAQIHHSLEDFEEKYREAFSNNGTPHIVVAFVGNGDIYIVESLEQLWRERQTISARDYTKMVSWGFRMVLCIPIELWERIHPDLDSERLFDLTTSAAPV